jgi:hypothetical protein
MRVKVMIASGVVVVLVAGLVVALILRHGSRPVSAQAPASARAASSRRSVPPAAASAIRLLVSARGRSALTPELNTALSPGRLFPAGTMFTAMPGTWHQAGAYANVTGTLITGSEQTLMTAIQQRGSSPPPGTGPGDFGSQPYQGQISASSAVVSALIPVISVLPGGNDGELWAAGTYLVPSGAPVSLQSLFASPSQGMTEMARLARAAFTAKYSCISQDASAFGNDPFEPDWAPTPSNYRYWSMTPAGLSIGFINGFVADEACGRMQVTLGWSQLRPWLTTSAGQLISELRSATVPGGAPAPS